jgi:hypothetical protein
VYVSVSDDGLALGDAEDTKTFKVVATLSVDVDQALRAAGWGNVVGEDALISISAVRRAASGQVSEAWSDSFEGMLAYARSKGWLSKDGAAIQAHIERES